MSVILEYKQINKSFGEKEVLKDINLKVESNKIVGLLGKNGSGKSTLFKLANDLLTPTSGEILIDGKPISVESKKIVSGEGTESTFTFEKHKIFLYQEDFSKFIGALSQAIGYIHENQPATEYAPATEENIAESPLDSDDASIPLDGKIDIQIDF